MPPHDDRGQTVVDRILLTAEPERTWFTLAEVSDLEGGLSRRLVPEIASLSIATPVKHASARRMTAYPEAVRRGAYASGGKRVFDVVVALLALIVAFPTMVGIWLVLRLTLGKNVIFRQTRVGRHGQDFTMLKFRTMRHSRRQAQRPFDGVDRRQTHKHHADPRHTKLGKVLRKTSLDELPQLFNVLRSEMSLVGPRPEIADVVDRYGLRSHARHTATPGVTGAWQIARRNDGTLLHECFDDDLAYVSNLTFASDMKILVSTCRVLLSAGGG